jgi:hypothetical protein
MADGSLTQTMLDLARHLAMLPDDALTGDWPAASQPGGFWYGYDENLREVIFSVYVEMRRLATEIASKRPPATTAQRALAQHQIAYRDLTGSLAGVREDEFDQTFGENEWPLRTVLYHIGLTERGFHALIHWAVRRQREGNQFPIEMPDDFRDEVSERIVEDGTLHDVLARFEKLHSRVIDDFTNLTEADLDAPNVWWEGYEVPVRFRLHRFDAHLREHTIQVDKTLAGIGHDVSEPERLARLLHRAIGEVEGALIGAGDIALADREAVTKRGATILSTLSSI